MGYKSTAINNMTAIHFTTMLCEYDFLELCLIHCSISNFQAFERLAACAQRIRSYLIQSVRRQ
jgi:hypothetical protein